MRIEAALRERPHRAENTCLEPHFTSTPVILARSREVAEPECDCPQSMGRLCNPTLSDSPHFQGNTRPGP